MAPQLGNFVLETATAPGTGSFTLNGPETSRRSFSAAFPNGGSVFYFADDGSSAEWGVGTLTIGTPSTLSRTTIIGTTSGGTSALNFSGSVEVYNEIPAEYVPVLEQDGSLTLAGGLTVKGKALVQNVADFTSQEAIPAAQADGRYIRSPYSATTDYRVLTISRNKESGGIYAAAEDGSNTQLQPAGDYATNPALNTEITNRTNADTDLQSQINNRVQKTGDTIDWLTITGGSVTTTGYSGNDGVSGGISYATGLTSAKQSGDTPLAIYRFINQNGVGPFATIWLTDNQGNGHELRYGADDRLRTASGNLFALTSELPFTDQNLRVQVFNAIASDGAFVTLPQAFRTLVGVTAQQHSSGGEGIRPIRIETNVFRGDGFNVSIWSRGGGIQYTFVAYGYL